MKITIIGSGYVGLVSGICLAKIGHDVICVDKIAEKIIKLQKGEIPIFEPQLKEMLSEVVGEEKISFTSDLKKAVENSSVIFIAVGTPQGEDGSADLSYVLSAAEEIAQFANEKKLVVTKSTVPTGTGAAIKEILRATNSQVDFMVASNPEFLREGSAIADFMRPDRIVIGVEDDESKKILSEIYDYFGQEKIIAVDVVTAELIKYAANSFLATKIGFINQMADLCEKVGGDVRKLSYAIGLDERIGGKFLNPGPGFGGSCFPKDILALLKIAQENKADLSIVKAVALANETRKIAMAKKVALALGGEVRGKKIALLGLAFKGNTDDIRYSPAIVLAKELVKNGAEVLAHDFEAIENARRELVGLEGLEFVGDYYEAMRDVDVIVIATEWKEYARIDLGKVREVSRCRKIVDLRNLLDKGVVKGEGFEYYSVG